MKVKVICKCGKELCWEWGTQDSFCPKCGTVKWKEVKIAPGELGKLFQ